MNTDGPSGGVIRILAIVGGIALMMATAVDVVSVTGRNTGWPLIGSIELVQAAVVFSAATGMVVATLERSHAIVHVLVNRLGPDRKRLVLRLSGLASALFFAALAIGAAWSFAAHWGGHEESELLGIPYAPLRLVLFASCAAVATIFAWHAVRDGSK